MTSKSLIQVGDRVHFIQDPPHIQPFEVLEVLPSHVKGTHPDWKFSQGLLKHRLITELKQISDISQSPQYDHRRTA